MSDIPTKFELSVQMKAISSDIQGLPFEPVVHHEASIPEAMEITMITHPSGDSTLPDPENHSDVQDLSPQKRVGRAQRMARRRERLARGPASDHKAEIIQALAQYAEAISDSLSNGETNQTDIFLGLSPQSSSTGSALSEQIKSDTSVQMADAGMSVEQNNFQPDTQRHPPRPEVDQVVDMEVTGGTEVVTVSAQPSGDSAGLSDVPQRKKRAQRLARGRASDHHLEIAEALARYSKASLSSVESASSSIGLSSPGDLSSDQENVSEIVGEESSFSTETMVTIGLDGVSPAGELLTHGPEDAGIASIGRRAQRMARGRASDHYLEIDEAEARLTKVNLSPSNSTTPSIGLPSSGDVPSGQDNVSGIVDGESSCPTETMVTSGTDGVSPAGDLPTDGPEDVGHASIESCPKTSPDCPSQWSCPADYQDKAVIKRLRHLKITCPTLNLKDLTTFDMGRKVKGMNDLLEIGRGSYGRVLLARHAESAMPVAIKQPSRSNDFTSPGELIDHLKSTRTRATKEAMVHELLSSSSFFPRSFGTIEAENDLCLAIEFVGDEKTGEGFPLFAPPPLSAADGLAIAEDVVRGMMELHDHGLLHNDLKSDNVLLKRHGDRHGAVIIDFGLVSTITAPMQMGGVPEAFKNAYIFGQEGNYLAPEVIIDEEPTSTHSDIFSVGRLLLDITQVVEDRRSPVLHSISELAIKCMHRFPNSRPSLEDVLNQLINMKAQVKKPSLWRRFLKKFVCAKAM